MVEELKPCPFCGKEGTIIVRKGKDGWRDRYAVLCDYEHGGCGSESGWYHYEEEAIEAWNRRSEQKEPDFYICTESFLSANIGNEGELLETQSEILKGSMWSKEKSEYRFCSTSDSVRLENSERWIEISSDSFSKYFKPVWRNK